jgi:cupin fold WbuC family metalloprotein
MRGRIAVVFFDNEGKITEYTYMGEKCEVKGIDISPGVWHTLISLEDTVLFEVKEGPYKEDTDKEFAIWAPDEGSPESEKYLIHLIANIGG